MPFFTNAYYKIVKSYSGAKGTAIDIMSLALKNSKFDIAIPKANEKCSIHNVDTLVDSLATALCQHIDYQKYHVLPNNRKQEIKIQIAEKLLDAAKEYTVTRTLNGFDNTKEIHKRSYSQGTRNYQKSTKGICLDADFAYKEEALDNTAFSNRRRIDHKSFQLVNREIISNPIVRFPSEFEQSDTLKPLIEACEINLEKNSLPLAPHN